LKPECIDCPYKASYVAPQLRHNTDIMFIGQNPGEEEIKDGYPFSQKGKCGSFLRRYIAKLKPEIVVSITNAVKCGTPNNKAPSVKEIRKCNDILLEEIGYCNPKLIVVLGKTAMIAVTGVKEGILKWNGKIMFDREPPVLVCVHPSFIIRGKDLKIFEKGILPMYAFFDEGEDIEVKDVNELESTDEEVGFDIETTSLRPQTGKILCFSVSNGKKALYGEIE
jgi:uracil-DNA glycosylase family 4